MAPVGTRSALAAFPSRGGGGMDDRSWNGFGVYQDGKSRRFSLLFTVNGGAFALVGFLAGDQPRVAFGVFSLWAFVVIPLALVLFTRAMRDDFFVFGEAMRQVWRDAGLGCPEIFSEKEQRIVRYVTALICASWGLAVALVVASWLLAAVGVGAPEVPQDG
jgi:hypothetical protein